MKCQKLTQETQMSSANKIATHQAGRKWTQFTWFILPTTLLLTHLLHPTSCQMIQQQQQTPTLNSNSNNKQLLSSLFINQLLSSPSTINRTAAAIALLATRQQLQQQQAVRFNNATSQSINSQTTSNPRSSLPVSLQTPTSQPNAILSSSAPAINSAARAASYLNNNNSNSSTSLAAVRLKWRQMEQSIGGSINLLSGQLRDMLSELGALEPTSSEQHQSSGELVSSACRLALNEFLNGLDNQLLWATQMLDASARLPSGMLGGTLTELGNFDQCLSISNQLSRAGALSNSGERSLSGQYCSILVKPYLIPRPRLHTVCQRLPALSASTAQANQTSWRLLSQNSHQFHYVGLRLGLCTPSKCSRADLQLLLSAHLAKYELSGQVKSCQVSTAPQERLDYTQQAIVSLFAALLVLAAVGTSLDYLKKGNSSAAAVDQQHLKRQQAAGHDLQPVAQRTCKRPTTWREYQVYQSSESSSKSQPVDTTFEQVFSLNTQFNPLVSHLNSNRQSATDNCFNPFTDKQRKAATVNYSDDDLWIERSQCETNKSREQLNSKVLKKNLAQWIIEFLTCFSMRRNLSLIGKHVTSSSSDEIRVIHGLRTLTMVWIIFGHTIGLVSPEMMNNLFSLAQLSCSSRILQAMLNATLAVNTFFMLSGLVTVTSFARRCKSALPLIAKSKPTCSSPSDVNASKQAIVVDSRGLFAQDNDQDSSSIISSLSSSASSNRCINRAATGGGANNSRKRTPVAAQSWWPADFQPLLWLAARYLRLTPAYAATIGLAMLLPALGSGPFWQDAAGAMGSNCRRNWWLNLLYVNNFIDTDKLCLIHSWYLSNDYQFFCIAMILLAVFYKSKRVALLLLITLIFASSAATFALTVSNEFPPTIVTTSPAVAERWLFIHALYYKPWPHLSSYLVGLCVGYLIVQRDCIKMSLAWRRFAWILCILVSLSLLNSIYPWNMGLQVEPILSGLHSATFRTLWAMCSGWLVFALAMNPSNPLGRLLSWHGFQVSSRLTYCAYLVHPLIIYYHLGSLRERMDSSLYGQTHRFAATLVLSYLFALILSLLVESPSIQVQRLFCQAQTNEQQEARCAKPIPATRRPRTHSQAHKLNSSTNSHETQSSSNSWSASSSFSEPSPQATTSELQTHLAGKTDELGLEQHCNQHHHRQHRSQQSSEANSSQLTHSQSAQQQTSQSLSKGANQSTCLMHPQTIDIKQRSNDCCSSSSDSSMMMAAPQTDVDFQRKLAQAIGRGFRLRSKLASGDTIRQLNGANRRASQVKRLPENVPVFARLAERPKSATAFVAAAAMNGNFNTQVVAPQAQIANKRPCDLGTFKQRSQQQASSCQASKQQQQQPSETR